MQLLMFVNMENMNGFACKENVTFLKFYFTQCLSHHEAGETKSEVHVH